jgi:hypothetical protein
MWKWGKDRYHTGYDIFTIFFSKCFDCYFFKYHEGSYIPRHKDPSSGRRVYRLNVVLKKPDEGGEFVCNKMIWSWKDRVFLFRADTSYHYVTPIEKGSRWLFSLGFKPKK